MCKVGEVVDALVTDVETYGIYLQADGHKVLVLIPEVTWFSDVSDCRTYTQKGAVLCIMILQLVEEHGMYMGSVKQAFPEQNPWRDPSRFGIGSVWKGVVKSHMTGSHKSDIVGHVLQIAPGVLGVLIAEEHAPILSIGQEALVEIKEVNVEDKKIQVIIHRA